MSGNNKLDIGKYRCQQLQDGFVFKRNTGLSGPEYNNGISETEIGTGKQGGYLMVKIQRSFS